MLVRGEVSALRKELTSVEAARDARDQQPTRQIVCDLVRMDLKAPFVQLYRADKKINATIRLSRSRLVLRPFARPRVASLTRLALAFLCLSGTAKPLRHIMAPTTRTGVPSPVSPACTCRCRCVA